MKAPAVWAYRLLLRLFPPRVRERDGEEMEAVFAAMWADTRGNLDRIRCLARTFARLPLVAAAEWWDRLGEEAERIVRDVRHGLRGLARSPGFALAAVFSLALGIGANTAVFTVADRVLMKPLPVSEPDELVSVTVRQRGGRIGKTVSYPFYTAVRDSSGIFRELIARAGVSANASLDGRALRIRGELVSANYFSSLGVEPAVGRTFLGNEQTPGGHPVAVISHGFFQEAFGLESTAMGRSILIDETLFTIVGVAAEGFHGTDIGSQVDVWLPLAMQAELGRDHFGDRTNWLEVIGRLSEGVGIEQAEAAISLELARHAEDATEVELVSAARGNAGLREEIGTALALLMTLTGLGVFLACSNVGTLLLARFTARAQELSTRRALGAGPLQLARQLLAESLTISLLGGVVAVAAAPWAAGLMTAFHSERLQTIDTSVDWRVAVYALGAALAAGLLLSLLPLLRLRRIAVPSARGSFVRWQDGLVVGQLATSIVMLVFAGLLLQTLGSLRSVDPGFRSDNLMLVSLDPGSAGYEGTMLGAFWEETIARARSLPGVRSASLAGTTPLAPGRQRQHVAAEGVDTGGDELEIDSNFVGPDYFRTLEIPVVRGRDFRDDDRMTSPHVAIVNEALARILWPGQDPIGERIRVGSSTSPYLDVVAVVEDARYRSLRDEPLPMVYRPVLQTGSSDMMVLHLRVDEPGGMAELVREQLRSMDADLPVFDVTTFEDELDASLGATRQAAALSGGFGALALILSAVGLYGLMAFTVRAQTRSIGIRIALGASASDIVALIGTRGLSLLLVGSTVGCLTAYALTRAYSSLLFGVGPTDGLTFAGAALVLAVAAIGAMIAPARAATRLDPVWAIRNE